MSLESFGEEQIYNFEHIGSFGRFYSGESFPIEYIMTTFSAAELSDLTFARDIRPDKIDFELLLQRDIDEERVRLEMAPYLNPNPDNMTSAEIRSRSVFFPPLLAAIVPTHGKIMASYYSDEMCEITDDNQTDKKHVIREWQGLFKLTYFVSTHIHAYHLKMTASDKKVGVQCEPVKLEIRLAKGNQYGTKLVIIDGQHRLFTLKQVYDKHHELLDNIRVPVCILFAPNATAQQNKASAPYRVPTVPEVFRHLFVDVNNTAKQVGGHFNILLSDDSIGSIVCRKFCDHVLNTYSTKGLAVIEWNTKTKSDSAKITRAYSLTSIGIIDKALETSIGTKKLLLKYVLKLDDVQEQLYHNGEEEGECILVKWNKFTLSQKNILEKQVEKYLIPCLILIFFKTHEFSAAFDIFAKELDSLKKLAESEQQDAPEAQLLVNQILDYMPIGKGKSFENARLVSRNFEECVKKQKNEQLSPMLQYALFQKAIFDTWAVLLELSRTVLSDPLKVTQGFVTLLNLALAKQGQFFVFEQVYMQHTVFKGNHILVRQETRKFLTQLLIAHLANAFNAKQVCRDMGMTGNSGKKLLQKLQEKGQSAANEFPKCYEIARKKMFKANYRVYLSIDGKERTELAKAEEEQKRHLQEIKEGKRLKTDISDTFDILVDKHVKSDVELAIETLHHNLFARHH